MNRRVPLRSLCGFAACVALAAAARADAPADQYELFSMNDVIIQDHYTKLVWQRHPALQPITFDDAAAYCASLALLGYRVGWRLPSYKELLTLVDESPHPEYTTGTAVLTFIDANAFPGTPAAPFWTSSTYLGQPVYAYAVNFLDGTALKVAMSATSTNFVRCVHD